MHCLCTFTVDFTASMAGIQVQRGDVVVSSSELLIMCILLRGRSDLQ